MNYYEHHLGDYARDAGHLSMIEDGAYRRLIDVYYARELPLPVDIKECQKLTRCTSAAERKAVEYVLAKFFRLADDGYHQKRCDEEIGKAKARIEAARLNGKKGGRPKANPNPELTHKEPSGFPSGSNQETQPFISANPEKSSPPPTSHLKDSDPSDLAETAVSIDRALFADARKVFGSSIGGQVNKAIKSHGKPWLVGVIESCKGKDPEAARAYFSAALKSNGSPNAAEQRRMVP